MDAYDAIPYDRQAVRETHPAHLAALARLYGIDAADPASAQVLELGCAAGANLIPMAWFLPGAQFLGLDLAASQVEAGQAQIAALGLSNIELQRADVADVEPGTDGFDFIIAHGLYSWVPAAVRSALLGLIRRQLRPGGVAYLSFNAQPGWQMRGMLREMLLYHVRTQVQPHQRLHAAREFLQFLATGLQGLDALSAQYLRHELASLERAPDSYLFHEYLATVNEPVLFADFVAAANAAGLRYLCNAELHYQFPAALGDGAERALAPIADPLARQQYLDFLLNRNFHQALLVRDDRAAPPAEPDYERFAALALFADLVPPHKVDLRKAKPQPFTDRSGQAHPVSHPLSKAALMHLYRVYPQALAFSELESVAQAQVAAAGDPRAAGQAGHLFGELFHLFAHGAVGACPSPGGALPPPALPPVATALARSEAGAGRLVDSRHASVVLDPAAIAAIAALDGSHDAEALGELLRVPLQGGRRVDPAILLRQLARRGALLG